MRAISRLSAAFSLPSSGLSFTDLLRFFAFCHYVGGKDQDMAINFFSLSSYTNFISLLAMYFLKSLEAPYMEKEITDHGN